MNLLNFRNKLVILIGLSLHSLNPIFAKQLPPQSIRMGYGSINPAEISEVLDCVFPGPETLTHFDRHVENFIILGVDYDCPDYVPAAAVTVELFVKYYDESNTLISSGTEFLSIEHTINGVNTEDKAILVHEGAYRIWFEVIDITVNSTSPEDLPINMYIESQIVIERFYDFESTAAIAIDEEDFSITTVNIECATDNETADFLHVTWPAVPEAEEYDLEWTFVNDYGSTNSTWLPSSSLTLRFRNNSTRVTCLSNYFDVPLIFDHGYIAFRVRPVGRSFSNYDIPIFGTWSTQNEILVSAIHANAKYYNEDQHESKLNWQLTSTYAEEGKHKEVISYFDGTLRNRQSVTRLSTSGVAVVGETIYDFTGRAAIQILPTPVGLDACSGLESSIHFYKDFNMLQVASFTVPFTAAHFDPDSSPCEVESPPLLNTSGASKYYSDQNDYLGLGGSFLNIPTSDGYPYSQVEYTPDNTGRIRRQGGVGMEFQLGSGHETSYLYGMPHQIQLDRLFGSEAGYFQHYKKNVVTDPNGQVSISYLDMSDRVVATALAGPAPENLEDLPIFVEKNGEGEEEEIINDYLPGPALDLMLSSALIDPLSMNPGPNHIVGESIQFNYQLVVPYESDYSFAYEMSIDAFSDACFEMCAYCYYDLSISITNSCGVEIWPTESDNVKPLVGMFVPEEGTWEFSTECPESEDLPYSYEKVFIIENLEKGEYTISKTLTVNQDARDFFISQFLTDTLSSCVQTFNSIYLTESADLPEEDCAIEFTCQDCFDQLGDRDEYIATGPDDFITNALVYDWKFEECKRECQTLSNCSAGYGMMLADMAPGGQYGKYEQLLTGGITMFNTTLHQLSIYNEDNLLPQNSSSFPADWKHPKITLNNVEYPYYLNDEGTRSTIAVLVNGTNYLPEVDNTTLVYENASGGLYTYPENLTNCSDFIYGYWQMNWARSLVTYHPEYCYYLACKEYGELQYPEDYITSDQFDELLDNTTTFADAYDFGLITDGIPSGYITTDWFQDAPSGLWPFSTDDSDVPYDPFVAWGNDSGEIFAGSGTPYFYGDQLEDLFNNYTQSLTPISMVALATYSIVSSVDPTNAALSSTDPQDWADLFGANVGDPGDYVANKNAMWTALKSIYLGAKRELQSQRNNIYAIEECAGYNGCFGIYGLGNYMEEFEASSSSTHFEDQPCHILTRHLYANSTPRFPDSGQIMQTVPTGTSPCPIIMNFTNLLNALIQNEEFVSEVTLLEAYPEFIHVFANPSVMAPPFPADLKWEGAIDGDDFIITLTDSEDEIFCEINIDADESEINWNELYYVANFTFTGVSTFQMRIYYYEDDQLVYETVSGSTNCISRCESPSEEGNCHPNPLIADLLNLMNAIVDINSTLLVSNLVLSPTYDDYLTSTILNIFPESDPGDLRWTCTGYLLTLWSTDGASIELDFESNLSSLISDIDHIISIDCRVPSPPPLTNHVEIYCEDIYNNPITLKSDGNEDGKSFFCNCIETASNCCQGIGYQEFFDVKSYIEEQISDIQLSGEHILNPHPYTNLLGNYYSTYSDPLPLLLQNTSIGLTNYEKITFRFDNCNLEIYMEDFNTSNYQFPDLEAVIINDFTLVGPPDADGNYYNFEFTYGGHDFFGSWCVPMKICAQQSPCGSVVPPPDIIFTPGDPCVDMLQSNAASNTANAYEQWLQDFTGNLENAYTQHCLNNVTEKLITEFQDLEYHYTLYYYDQAGNLVRTVPPAGVKPLDLKSYEDPLSQRIAEDRYSGQRRIYTFHNMATTYTYNSLNQLVHQSIPDHDNMNIWETSIAFGVDQAFEANEIQFASAANGFMGGELASNYPWAPTGNVQRGVAYRSIDGGALWQRMDGLVASDLLKIEMISNVLGYAVGKDGVFVRTRDGGATWDMLETYKAFNTILPMHFTDFAFNRVQSADNSHSSSLVNYSGILVGLNGVMVRMNFTSSTSLVEGFERISNPVFNYGEALSIVPSFTTDGDKWDFSSVICSGDFFNILVNFPGGFEDEGFSLPFSIYCRYDGGPSFKTTSVNSLEFTCDYSLRASDLMCNHIYNSQSAFAGGKAGRLFHCADMTESGSTYAQWFQVPTNIVFDFKKLFFYDEANGIAIVDEGAGGSAGAIYTSKNSGRTWSKLSSGTIVFNDIYGYDYDPTCMGNSLFDGCRILAVGNEGKIARITIVANTGFGYELIASPTTVNLNTCWGHLVKDCTNASDRQSRFFVAGDDGKVFTLLVYGNSLYIHWQEINSAITDDFIDMEISANGTTPAYPQLNGVLLTSTGDMYSIYIPEGKPDCDGADAACNTSTLCPNHCETDYLIAPVIWPSTAPTISNLTRVQGNSTAEDFVFAFEQTDTGGSYTYGLHRFDLSGVVTSPTTMSFSDVATDDEHPFYDLSSYDASSVARINLVGRNGFNYSITAAYSGTTIDIVNDDRYAIRPLSNIDLGITFGAVYSGVYYNASVPIGTHVQCIAAGRNGSLWIRRHQWSSNALHNSWNLFDTGIVEDITAVEVARGFGSTFEFGPRYRTGMIGTSTGRLIKWKIDRDGLYSLPGVISEKMVSIGFEDIANLNKRINGIACPYTATGPYAIIVGDQGLICKLTMLTSGDYVPTSSSYLSVYAAGNVNYYGVSSLYSSNTAFICGQNARIEKVLDASHIICNDIFIPRIHDIHFLNSAEGYVISNGFTIRHTTDGGNTWKVVLPNAALGVNLPTLNKVATQSPGLAFVVGNDNNNKAYILRLIGNTAYVESTSGITNIAGTTLLDIQYDALGRTWAVGRSNNIASIFYRSDNSSTWTQVNYPNSATISEFRAMHIFPSNNSIIACGYRNASSTDYPLVNVFSAGSWNDYLDYSPPSVSGFKLNDIFFHDDIVGYMVGSNGKLFKTDANMTLPDNYDDDGLLEVLTEITWETGLPINPTTFFGQATVGNMELRTIAFSNRWEGLWGGKYAGSPTGYVRRITDESEIFSTRFWYDRLGRITASQNTKQYNASSKRYSYTLYDELGRVVEAGEKTENEEFVFKDIFGVWVEGYLNRRTINDASRNAWIEDGTGIRREVTTSYYDEVPALSADLPAGFDQDEALLRKRIAAVTYETVWDNNMTTYDHATHYDYDIHGNVKTLIQDNHKIFSPSIDGMDDYVDIHRHKRIDYRYDLISGNVKQVSYQAGKPDQFYHCYEYDADNRITDVYTSRQGWDFGENALLNCSMPGDWLPYFQHDASYEYYLHGPLARVEIGDIKVQGLDYAYTLQGWLKGVNSNHLEPVNDLGHDGATGTRQLIGRDAMGFTLGYRQGDYTPIGTGVNFEIGLWDGMTSSSLANARRDLWNGNIGHMVTTLFAPEGSLGVESPQENIINGMAYQYDQLNRLTKALGFNEVDLEENIWSSSSPVYDKRYQNHFTYDPNGNILTQTRHDAQGVQFEDLKYRYDLEGYEGDATSDDNGRPLRNRLYHVNDDISTTARPDDIEDQGTFGSTGIEGAVNYAYDEIGQLIADEAEEIESIEWRVDGKISAIFRDDMSALKELKFDYDAMGNRIAKHVLSATGVWEKTTYYVRDAQGNVMSTYEYEVDEYYQPYFYITEQHIYGSSRLGMVNLKGVQVLDVEDPTDVGMFEYERGQKQYELSNHLGNVLSVISDQKLPELGSYSTIEFYYAEVVSFTDYYPFGSEMTERSWQNEYRYSFNGKERDSENTSGSYDFGARMLDARLGRWLSVDHLAKAYCWESPYSFCKNSSIQYIDVDGNKWINPYTLLVSEAKAKLQEIEASGTKSQIRRQTRYVNKLQEAELKVKNAIQDISENDPELYNYIENLKITETHGSLEFEKEVPVTVFMISANDVDKNGKQYAGVTTRLPTNKSLYKANYNDEEIFIPQQASAPPGTIGGSAVKPGRLGFTVTLVDVVGMDSSLANEAGDVMYFMEKNTEMHQNDLNGTSSDADKTDSEYRSGGTGKYSFDVEEVYKNRKSGKESKDTDKYPLKK